MLTALNSLAMVPPVVLLLGVSLVSVVVALAVRDVILTMLVPPKDRARVVSRISKVARVRVSVGRRRSRRTRPPSP